MAGRSDWDRALVDLPRAEMVARPIGRGGTMLGTLAQTVRLEISVQRAIRRLRKMAPWQLADIGISRDRIERAVRTGRC